MLELMSRLDYLRIAPKRATHVINMNGVRSFAFYDKTKYQLISKRGGLLYKTCEIGQKGWFITCDLEKKLLINQNGMSFASGAGIKGK